VLEKVLDPNETILNIGCGNSLFSEDLHDNGFKKIVNVDFSESVVKEMAKRSEKLRP
jgi:2-polyprenyl-3-methyl-5-hydroxy-6-metoxy-1,4-benzoquinol methylase